MTDRVKEALEKIRLGLACGESLPVARKKSCGTPTAGFAKQVMYTQEYVDILNEYMIRINKPIRYTLGNNCLEWQSVPKNKTY